MLINSPKRRLLFFFFTLQRLAEFFIRRGEAQIQNSLLEFSFPSLHRGVQLGGKRGLLRLQRPLLLLLLRLQRHLLLLLLRLQRPLLLLLEAGKILLERFDFATILNHGPCECRSSGEPAQKTQNVP